MPNPVRERAAVALTLPAASDADVAVFDPLGRRVSQLATGPVGPGRHEVSFDASGVPSGVYVIRLAADGEVRTARLTVVR